MDLAHRRLTPDLTLCMFLVEAWIASAVIYACTTFGLFFSLGYSSAPGWPEPVLWPRTWICENNNNNYINEGHFWVTFIFHQIDSIWWKHSVYVPGTNLAPIWKPRIAYVYCQMFFPNERTHRSAVTATQQPATSRSIFCVFGSFASSVSRHIAYRAVIKNKSLRPPLFVLTRHSRGTLWYDHSAV